MRFSRKKLDFFIKVFHGLALRNVLGEIATQIRFCYAKSWVCPIVLVVLAESYYV